MEKGEDSTIDTTMDSTLRSDSTLESDSTCLDTTLGSATDFDKFFQEKIEKHFSWNISLSNVSQL